jgi:hypothetical protein
MLDRETCSSTLVCSLYRLAWIYHNRATKFKLGCQIDEALTWVTVKLTGRERDEGGEQIVVLRTVRDMCLLPPQRTLSFVLRSTDGSWSQGRICRYRHIGQERVARRYNASAIQAAGFNVRSEVPSHGYFHVMREVLMYLPGRAMACAG